MRNVPGERTPRRSDEWFERRDLDGFLHRSWLKSTGVTDETFRGRPVIGIRTSWSELVNCNVAERRLDVLLDEEVLALRRSRWSPPTPADDRGYRHLHANDLLQANEGCDFDFLRGRTRVVDDSVTYL